MTKFFFRLKETYVWLTYPIFWEKIVFPKNQTAMHNFIRISSTMPNLMKSYDGIPGKLTDRYQEERMDRTYFIGSFPLFPGDYQAQLQ